MSTTVEPVAAASDQECTYYPETGHQLCFGLRDYWEAHGGLAIFGYPISAEMKDANGTTVQWFERARFEYHPEQTTSAIICHHPLAKYFVA